MPTVQKEIKKKYIFEYSHDDIVNLIMKDIYENDKSINVTNADLDFSMYGKFPGEISATITIENLETE